MKPDFNTALKQHFAAIANRDIAAFTSHLTRGDTLYTIVQNGHAFTTPSEAIAIHEQWFKDPNWTWEGRVVHQVVGEDVAMALVRYQYRPKAQDTPLDTWLTYVFELQDGQWRIVHDQNTALDFPAFARANGMERKKIFINLPVANLPRTLAFWQALGYAHNPQFTDDTAACIVISEEIYHMALTHAKWRGFTPKAICDTSRAAEVSLCLSCESRAKVDELIAAAVAAGGAKEPEPTDHGFMYMQGFDDPDGHHWELVHMSAVPPA